MKLSVSFRPARYLLVFSGLLFLFTLQAHAQDNHGDSPPAVNSEHPFRLKASTNLVVVRVIVRGSDGTSVEGLKKEDFRIFDRGKEQSISQFEVEASSLPSNSTVATKSAPSTGDSTTLAASSSDHVASFVSLYFDDLN